MNPSPFACPIPDAALVRRLAQRDATALIELQRRYASSLYAQVFAIVMDRERADQVVTRAFEQLRQAALGANGGPGTLSWLQQTAVQLARAERSGSL
jgi:DNA-directed RNA polymerase specialized sigma24 family protein